MGGVAVFAVTRPGGSAARMQTLRNIRLRDVCRARIECTDGAGFGEGDSAHRRYRKHEPGSPCSIGDGTMVEGVRRLDWRMSGYLR